MGVVGPTASGKSALAHAVARTLGDVEIVTVDSMQVYAGMDIGTAKPTPTMRAEVPYHLLDIADPAEEFSLRAFQRAALAAIAGIESRGRRPMLVGGTGLYVRAVVDELEIPGRFPGVRADLEARHDLAGLYRDLEQVDPVAASRIEPGNRRRIVRALEVCLGSGRPFSSFGEGLDAYGPTEWDLVALEVETPVLNARIEDRFADQLADGFLDEVRRLTSGDRPLGRTAAQALGYRQFAEHLRGATSFDEALEAAIAATRRFGRRQRSWFGRDPRLEWLDATDPGAAGRIDTMLRRRWRRAR